MCVQGNCLLSRRRYCHQRATHAQKLPEARVKLVLGVGVHTSIGSQYSLSEKHTAHNLFTREGDSGVQQVKESCTHGLQQAVM